MAITVALLPFPVTLLLVKVEHVNLNINIIMFIMIIAITTTTNIITITIINSLLLAKMIATVNIGKQFKAVNLMVTKAESRYKRTLHNRKQ